MAIPKFKLSSFFALLFETFTEMPSQSFIFDIKSLGSPPKVSILLTSISIDVVLLRFWLSFTAEVIALSISVFFNLRAEASCFLRSIRSLIEFSISFDINFLSSSPNPIVMFSGIFIKPTPLILSGFVSISSKASKTSFENESSFSKCLIPRPVIKVRCTSFKKRTPSSAVIKLFF